MPIQLEIYAFEPTCLSLILSGNLFLIVLVLSKSFLYGLHTVNTISHRINWLAFMYTSAYKINISMIILRFVRRIDSNVSSSSSWFQGFLPFSFFFKTCFSICSKGKKKKNYFVWRMAKEFFNLLQKVLFRELILGNFCHI